MFDVIISIRKSFLNHIRDKIKQFTKPATYALAAGIISDLSRRKVDLIVENAILRQQLIVLNRTAKRPKLTNNDRIRFILLARLTHFWRSALLIVQPDTLLRWHRDLFRRYWRWKSHPTSRKPRIPQAIIDLIKQMANENPSWGAKRIQGELLKLNIIVHKRTIKRHMDQVSKSSGGQNWATFLRNHAQDIWACDFTTVHTLFFKTLYVFVIIHHQSRRIIHTAVTTSPTDEWTTQQLREATAWGQTPKYLIRDNDSKFGSSFKSLLQNSGIKDINTPVRAPRANAICERFIGSLKRESLDSHLILQQQQLNRIVKKYVSYYDDKRPHQGLGQNIPIQHDKSRPSLSNKPRGPVVSTPILNGLHHHYAYAVQ